MQQVGTLSESYAARPSTVAGMGGRLAAASETAASSQSGRLAPHSFPPE